VKKPSAGNTDHAFKNGVSKIPTFGLRIYKIASYKVTNISAQKLSKASRWSVRVSVSDVRVLGLVLAKIIEA